MRILALLPLAEPTIGDRMPKDFFSARFNNRAQLST